MKDYKFISDITVEEIQQVGSDETIARAAWVSTQGAFLEEIDQERLKGLINYLVKQKHSSPLEHGQVTARVHAPIFCFRQWQRHRCASYSEESGRYKTLEPVFWVPRRNAKLIPNENFKPARPQFCVIPEGEEGDRLYETIIEILEDNSKEGYFNYRKLMALGIAGEIARCTLPLNTYSSMWVTFNPRAILGFLSLRTHNPEALFVSYPQEQIEEAALQLEEIFKKYWPITWEAFNKNGRVAP